MYWINLFLLLYLLENTLPQNRGGWEIENFREMNASDLVTSFTNLSSSSGMDDPTSSIPDWRKDLARMLTVIALGTVVLCLICVCIVKQRGLPLKGLCKCCLEDEMDYEPTSEQESRPSHRKRLRKVQIRSDPFPADRIRMEQRNRKWNGTDVGTTSSMDEDSGDEDDGEDEG